MDHTVDPAMRQEAAWERAECQALITELQGLRLAMVEREERLVPWLAQVLENLATTGLPSRAEITDAAMGERAECAMLTKGPHLFEAMRTLDSVPRCMEGHPSKKRPLLRALKAWGRHRADAPSRDCRRRVNGGSSPATSMSHR